MPRVGENSRRVLIWFILSLSLLFLINGLFVFASEGEQAAGHIDPFSFILFELAAVVAVAMLGRWMAEKLNQPSVLGELLLGVALGNIGYWLQIPMFTMIMHLDSLQPLFREVWGSGLAVQEAVGQIFSAQELAPGGVGDRILQLVEGPDATRLIGMAYALWMFSNLGVILLLFMVGLESRVDEMLQVGPRALMVALVGVVAPFMLGLGATYWLLPDGDTSLHLFLAAILCATSVGITARVFKDLGKQATLEARIILGAAVIDDVLGLIVLAVVSGIVVSGGIQFFEVLRISLLSFVFLAVVIRYGDSFVRLVVPLVTRVDRHHHKLLFPLTLAFTLAWAASLIELATIVGAFAAGLILNEEHFEKCSDTNETIEGLIAPLEAIFAPIFFVLMGMQVNLSTFADTETLYLALAFTVAALIGKFVAGLPAGSGVDRLSVGFGMIPRGEVGLIFASVGKGLGVVTDSIFSAVVIMVIVTTLITPILLRWSLFRAPPKQAAA